MSNEPVARKARHLALAALCGLATPTAAIAGVAAPGASACSLADAPREDFVMRVPFETIDGRIYVQASVDGHGPFRFAVDTGASGPGRADLSLVSARDRVRGLLIGQRGVLGVRRGGVVALLLRGGRLVTRGGIARHRLGDARGQQCGGQCSHRKVLMRREWVRSTAR